MKFVDLSILKMKMRHKECTKLLDTLLEINEGIFVKNVLKSSFDLGQFKVGTFYIIFIYIAHA